MKLDDELAAIKARVEAAQDKCNLAVDRHAVFIAHAPTDISRLLQALELCRRQRAEAALDDHDHETWDRCEANYDAALLEILRGTNENT
jgi:hypothetical protein